MLMQTEISSSSFKSFINSDILFAKRTRPERDLLSGLAGIPMNFARNAEIYGEGEAFGHVYKVVSGVVRVSKVLADGRRQISAFYLPGDIFGFEAGDARHFSAEAVVATKVMAFRWQSLLAAGARSAEFFHQILNVTMKDLRQTQEQLLLVGRKNALERVAAFLLEMSGRSGSIGMVELAMPRHDIADYLGLTLETVSRMFAELKELGAISLEGARRVRLLDRELLASTGA
jgi:CRP-like cAMP-binding protein